MSSARAGDPSQIARDPDAFEVFYRGHVEDVQRFLARRVADPYLVADLTADVFLTAIDSAGTYRSRRGAPVAWLYGIARNLVAAHGRRSARELRAFGRVVGRAFVDDGDLARLEERIDAERQARRLHHAMGRLSESERAVLELVALEGLAVTDAASALRISPVAARVRLHRARRLMRHELTPPIVPKVIDLPKEGP